MSRISCSSLAIGFVVEREDDVVRPEAGAVARRAGRDVLHERPAADRQLERPLQIGVDIRGAHADIAARHAAAGAKLRQDRRGAVDRDREPDVAGARADRGVDADDLAPRVDQRPAAVPEVDRRVGLDVVVEARIEELPAEVADDADRHGVLVAERVADREDPLAHPQRRRIAERRDRQPGLAVDLDQRDVGVGIGADDARAESPAVRQLHRDPLGAIDDVVVGQDAAVGVDDEAAAGAAPRGIALAAGPLSRTVRRTDPADRGSVRLRRLRGSRPRVVASMFTTAGLMRSTTSAKLTSGMATAGAAAPSGADGRGRATGRRDGRLDPPPAKIAPTRKATTAVSARVTNVKRRDIFLCILAPFHYKSQERLLIQRFHAQLLRLLELAPRVGSRRRGSLSSC